MPVAKNASSRVGAIKDPAVDWDGARLEFVTTTCTLEHVAKKFGVKGYTLRDRARKEDWEAKRAEYRDRFLQETTQAKIDNAAVRLAQWNEETLLHAGLLREAARRQFQYQTENGWRFRDDASSKNISAAAAAHVAADKLARLALGASTDNVNQTNKSLPATVDDFF